MDNILYFFVNWMNGICSLAIVCYALFFIAMAMKFYRNTKSHTFVAGIFLGLAIAIGWTGHSLTFLSVAILGYNLPWIYDIIGYFSFSTLPVGALAIVYVSWDVVAANRKSKRIVLGILGAFSVLYYYVLYSNWSQNVLIMPTPPDMVIHDYIPPTVPLYYLLGAEVLIAGLIALVGFLKFRSAVPGALRKKSTYIVIAAFMVGTSILWDILAYWDWVQPTLFMSRLLMVMGLVLILNGVKPVTELKSPENTEIESVSSMESKPVESRVPTKDQTASIRAVEAKQVKPRALPKVQTASVSPVEKKPVELRVTPSPTRKTCPACSATLPITAKFCNMCGLAQARPGS